MHRPATDRDTGAGGDRPDQGATKMSPTIRSLMLPVSDLEAAKALYTALLGSPHTDESYYVGYNVDGFEVALYPAGAGGGPVAFADVEDLDATRDTLLAAGATGRDAPRQVAPVRGYACSQMPTENRSACAGSRRQTGAVAAVAPDRSGPSGLRGEPACQSPGPALRSLRSPQQRKVNGCCRCIAPRNAYLSSPRSRGPSG